MFNVFFNIYFYKYTFQFIIKHFKENPFLRILNCLPQLLITKTQTTYTGKSMVSYSTHSNRN